MRLLPLLALSGLAALLGACGSDRYGPPLTETMPMREPELAAGKALFQEHCHQCHPNGASGIGPALNNKPLARSLIRLQTRKGLGAMPAFPEGRISESELERLIDYIIGMAALAGSDRSDA